MSPTLCPRIYTATIGMAMPFLLSALMLWGLEYCTPRYWRNRSVSVSTHVFCNSIRIRWDEPSSSLTVAPKSMRKTERVSRLMLVYSCGRTSTAVTSFFSKAERMVLAMRSSSMRYLNTMS